MAVSNTVGAVTVMVDVVVVRAEGVTITVVVGAMMQLQSVEMDAAGAVPTPHDGPTGGTERLRRR